MEAEANRAAALENMRERMAFDLDLFERRSDHDRDLFERKSQQERELFVAKLQHDFRLHAFMSDLGRLKSTYPFHKGPGHVRRTLRLMIPGFPQRELSRPLVFIEPVADESGDKMWVNARYQAEGLLSKFHNENRILVLTPDQSFGWPDPDLYTHDLFGIPTIVVYGKAGVDRLDIWLGGCHLLPHTPASPDIGGIPPSRHVMTFRYEHWHEQEGFTPDYVTMTAKDGSPLDIRLTPSGGQQVLKEEDKARRLAHRTMIGLASEAMAAIVVVLTDAFYLMRVENYDEQIDGFLADRGTKLDAIDIPDIPLKLIKDPGYHLLHKAKRLVTTKPERASEAVVEAMKFGLAKVAGAAGTEDADDAARRLVEMFRNGRVPNELVLFLRKALEVTQCLPEAAKTKKALLPPLQQLSDHRLLPFDARLSRG